MWLRDAVIKLKSLISEKYLLQNIIENIKIYAEQNIKIKLK